MTPSRFSAALLTPLLLLASCSTSSSGSAPASAEGSPAIRVTDASLLPATVDALPQTDVQAYEDLLGQLRGTPVVVNFWASWCEPCTVEMPMLVDSANARSDSIQFVGIDVLDNRGSATDFIARFDVPFPSLFDPNGDIRNAVGAIGQPVTVFYAADGTVVAKVEGQLSEEALTTNLAALTA